MDTLLKLVNLLEKYYFRALGLVIGYAIVLLIGIKIDPHLRSLIPALSLRISTLGLLFTAWTVTWWLSRTYFPSTRKNKIGLVIAINAENEKQKTRIKVDFAERLTKSLRQNNLSSLFEVIVLSDYRASRAADVLRQYSLKRAEMKVKQIPDTRVGGEVRKWRKFQKRIRGHFYVWGTIRERLDLENTYLLDLDGLVIHEQVGLDVSNKIQKEFLSIFPRQISFFEKLEIKGFQIAADTTYLATRYVTGIAAFVSGDPATALQLHSGLATEISAFASPLPPNLVHVSNQLNEMILAEKSLLAKHTYFFQHDVRGARVLIDECLAKSNKQYDALVLKSHIAFQEDRDPLASLKLLHLARKVSGNDFTWLYNRAFLWMYLGKFEKGVKDYKRLSDITFDSEDQIVDQCIQFNERLVKNEANKLQCFFIIAYLYFRKKTNLPMALEYFEKFRAQAMGKPNYKYLAEVSLSWIVEIKSQMQLSPRG